MSGLTGVRAGPELDARLLEFTASIGTGTNLRIALDRSPSFFGALDVEGEDPDVVAFVQGDRVVGCGAMTQRPVYLNGSRQAGCVGQLGSARVDPEFRGGTVVARCFRLLHEWHLERPARVFLTTILEDNLQAREIFESGRAGLPRYLDRGRLVTLSCPVGPRHRGAAPKSRGIDVVAGQSGDEEEVVEFWREHGPRRQFYPAYGVDHLRAAGGLLRGLGIGNLVLARAGDGGELLATLGLWDQSAFRRWVVHGLPRGLHLCAPVLGALARIAGGLPLPRPGEALRQCFAATTCVADDDAVVFAALLDGARRQLALAGGGWLTLGLHERDPLLASARRLRHREIHSRLYLVHWPEGEGVAAAIDPDRCPYVEVGGL